MNPTPDQIEAERQRLIRKYREEFSFGDFMEVLQGMSDKDISRLEKVIRGSVRHDELTLIYYPFNTRIRNYITNMVEKDLDHWIEDYPAREQLTREERERDNA